MDQVGLPPHKESLIKEIVAQLKSIDRIKAIVLGGSHAAGMANEQSDIDLGIYYFSREPFDIKAIKEIANRFAISTPTVTDFYGWGPWVNGGAWINTSAGRVDFVYREIEKVKQTINKAYQGIWETDYEQQPAYGFNSLIYLAETQCCVALHDPAAIIQSLKASIETFPEKLKASVVQQSLWSAEFAAWQAGNFAMRSDLYNTIGCLTRAINKIVIALFILNEQYPMGDKRAIELISEFPIKPEGFEDRIDAILSANKLNLGNNVSLFNSLFIEVVDLANGTYLPLFDLKQL